MKERKGKLKAAVKLRSREVESSDDSEAEEAIMASSGSDSDDVEEFTKMFMAKTGSNKEINNEDSSNDDEDDDHNGDSEDDDDDNDDEDDDDMESESEDDSKYATENKLSKHSSNIVNMEDVDSDDSSDSSVSDEEENQTVTNQQSKGQEDSASGNEDTSEEEEEEAESDDVESDGGENQSTDDESGEESLTPAQQLESIRKEIADLPFSELHKLRERVGIKAYHQAMFGTATHKTGKKKVFKRENKNRPAEMSSKRTVGRFRQVIQVKKKAHRDPRFDDLSGEYSDMYFKKNYGFLDDIKVREKQKLIAKYQKEKSEDKKKDISQLIKRLNQQDRTEREKEAKESKDLERKRREVAMIREGKKPYYLKKVDKKKLELADKYEELRKGGKLDKYLTKKRKKNASSDRKRMPNKS